MQFKKEERSIFPENFVETVDAASAAKADDERNTDNILNEIELLSIRAGKLSGHVLSRSEELKDEPVRRNNISDLVKAGHRLPEVKSVENMLSSDETQAEPEAVIRADEEGKFGIKPYRIVNLISGSYRLPEIDDDSFYR